MARERNEALWAEWRDRVARCVRRAESSAEFRRREGVSVASLYSWRRRARCRRRRRHAELAQQHSRVRLHDADHAGVEIDSNTSSLILNGVELAGARHRKRYSRPSPAASVEPAKNLAKNL